MGEVVVNRRARHRIRGGHLWVFRSDVKRSSGTVPGDVVEVRSDQGEFLGQAFFSKESRIALRLITPSHEPVNESFWQGRLTRALSLRKKITQGTNAYRWIHGESDGIPSLVVDRYGDYLSFQTLSAGTERLKDVLVRCSVDLVQPAGIIARNDQKVRALEGLALAKETLYGEVPRTVAVEDLGLIFQADLWEGQKTGLFLDQRENRHAAALYASGRALDVFAYDGGFSLHLARTCEKVLSVDTSAEALARLRRNAQRNRFDHIETIEANAFDLLRDLADRKEVFDTIVLDPPAFAKNRASVPQARRGYKEINLRALKLLRPGGYLITSTCSYHITEADFLSILAGAAADAKARLVVAEKRAQSRDHPVLLSMPETHYLKCLILRKW
ncbi:MAG: class I SAM-dependent rRNA methyltransferase [Acidobacteriota bacterium]